MRPDPRPKKDSLAELRNDFPVLARTMNDRSVAYLDTASSAQKPRAVIEAMTAAMETHYANVHRGLYAFSQETTVAFETARARVADFINAASSREIVFTRNATEAINLVARSGGETFLKSGDEVILSEMEHHANIVPWQMLRERMGIVLRIIPVKDDGTLDLEAYKKLLSPRTRLVALVHISNALGTVNSVKEIIEIAKNSHPEIKVMIDGSQSVVHSVVDVQDMGADFFVFTGHKLYGPTGIGVLWGKYEILESMPPYQGGGDMIEQVTFEKTTFKPPPSRFEAGTPAFVEAIGLAAAIDYVTVAGMAALAAREREILDYAQNCLRLVPGLAFYGTGPEKAGILSFTAAWGHPSDIAMILDQCGVAVRAGHHCCQPLMRRFGIEATIRASLGLYSSQDDIDALVEGLTKARSMLA